jgi:hypothetical protein
VDSVEQVLLTRLFTEKSAHVKNLDAHLNSFATRCFRDVADRDYISARLCYRAGLISQFHWAALQAFEKYFKAILLYNRIKAKRIGHNLAKAQKLMQKAPFDIRLSQTSEKLLSHLNDYGRFRYLETSYFIRGPKLVELDKAVWELRRYCRVLDYELPVSGDKPVKMLEYELEHIERAESQAFQQFRIVGGKLEAIIANKADPARAPLVWQNGFYGSSRRKSVRVPIHSYSENSPLFLHPQIMDHVLEYIFIPPDVVKAYSELATNSSSADADGTH